MQIKLIQNMLTYETFLYFHAGNKIGVYKSSEEVQYIEPNETAKPTFNLSMIALLELYQSLREEMIRNGLLARDLHEKERALVAKHLDDAIKVRDAMMKTFDVMVSGFRQSPTEIRLESARRIYTESQVKNAMKALDFKDHQIMKVIDKLYDDEKS